MNVIELWDEKVIGIMILFIYGYVLDLFQGIDLIYFIGSFDGIRDDVDGPCVGPKIRYIMTTYDKSLMNLKDYSTVKCRIEMQSSLLLSEKGSLMIICYVMNISIVPYSDIVTADMKRLSYGCLYIILYHWLELSW